MFNKKEIAWIIVAIIIFFFILVFPESTIKNPLILLVPILIILVNLIAKKIAAPYYNIEIEFKIWEFYRWGIYERSHLKKPFPMGLVLPFFLAFFSLGAIKMLVFLQFDAKNLPKKRLLKKRGERRSRREEINETDPAYTAFWGHLSLMILAILGTILTFPELTKYSIIYGIWNLVPFGQLDGSKLFFGSFVTWIFTIVLYLLTTVIIAIV